MTARQQHVAATRRDARHLKDERVEKKSKGRFSEG
jgi:hypothetical protein